MVATVEKVFVDPYEAEKKAVRRLMLYGFLCLFFCIALLAASVGVVIHSGSLSMQAFEELPRYRVNRLRIDYNNAVTHFEESIAATRAMLQSEESTNVLKNARALPQQVLQSEKGFKATIDLYSELTDMLVAHSGGAREWNRHFQNQLATLTTASENRQTAIDAFIASLPQPPAENGPASDPNDELTN